MPPLHTVCLADNFQSLLVRMPEPVRKDVLEILNALKADAYFVPSETEYLVTRTGEHEVLCTKIDGWDGWFLMWGLEFDSEKPDLQTVALSAISPSRGVELRRIEGLGAISGSFAVGTMKVGGKSGGGAGNGGEAPAWTTGLTPYVAPSRPPGGMAYPGGGGAAPPAPAAAPPAPAVGRSPFEKVLKRLKSAAFGAVGANLSYVRVFYSTDREVVTLPGLPPEYGPGRSKGGELQYGECEISIPKTHKLGKLESPSRLRFEFSLDPQKHIVLAAIESLDEEVFLRAVSDAVATSETREAFVFVHGYNVKFEDAARRTGQIAFDLNFVGAPILYSWPSNGRAEQYTFDETNAQWSQDHFKRFLCLLAQHVQAAKIHVIAHSMGNRVVCGALKELSLLAENPVALSQIVLAAPDMDAGTFKELAATLAGLSKGVTLYQSSKDKALLASKKIHGNPRAGEPVLVISGVDTIDASDVDTDFLGHAYYSDTWALISDIHALLAHAEPAARRVGMKIEPTDEGTYYVFRGA